MKTKLTLVTMLLFLLGCTTEVLARAEYTVLPLVIDEKVQSRDIITRQITLTNTGTQPVTIYPSVNNISLKEGGAIQEFLPPVESDRTTSLSSWIEISRLGIDLKGGESKLIPITFRIHPTPVPGTYHAFIGFGNGGNRDEAESQVKNGQAPGTIITITIEDKKNELLKLSKFIVDRFISSINNQAAVYTFTNPGDETVTPKGEIILYDSTGKEVASVPVNDENTQIPPGGEHTFFANVPITGLFGKYKAFLSVEYGSAQRASMQDTSFFYALPLKVIIIIISSILILVAGLSFYVHKKYFGVQDDDSDRLQMHVRTTVSEPLHHDVDLKKQ